MKRCFRNRRYSCWFVGRRWSNSLRAVWLAGWLGKIWANRLMESERQAHAIEFEKLRDSLQRSTEKELKSLHVQLEIAKETIVKEHLDRVTIYRAAIDLLAGILAKIVMIATQQRGSLSPEELAEFENHRLRVYAYLAMRAPQSVMDAHDSVMDLILELVVDGKPLNWIWVRELSLRFLNEVRKDIGINPEPVTYKGTH